MPRPDNIKADSKIILEQKDSVVKEYEDTVLYQFIPPSIQLLIAGAGNDAQPLVDMASLLGWNIIIADGRPTHATQQRFPKANKIALTKPVDIFSAIHVDEHTAVVLMTHNYNYDLAVLEQLTSTNCKYIGVLGPRKKLNKMLDDLNEKGIVISDEKMKNICKIFFKG